MNNSQKKGLPILMYMLLGSAVILGLLFGLIGTTITSKVLMVVFFIVYGLILMAVIRMILQMSVKRLVKRFNTEMEIIKQGDFSHLVDSKSYAVLNGVSSTVNIVLSDIRALIESFFHLSLSIIQASRKVSTTSQEASSSIEEISKTIDEIAKGASAQAAEAQQGVEVVEALSEQINLVYESYNGVMNETQKINSLNSAGLESVSVLREKSEQNYSMSQKIFAVIEKLTDTSKEISTFVQSIESIAEQTNLLALNASIEAARAGEAGRGFVVVAEEVRKLADQSRQSTEEITNLVQSIHEESLLAVEAMENMKKVSQEQNLAVNSTDKAFADIANAMNLITDKVGEVNQAISKVQSDKNQVISAIENISSVSQQTAASSQEVAATTEHQLSAIDSMRVAAGELDTLVQDLDKKLKKYKLR
ncbi:MAG: methyl-accepting chemotaxis protein [Bacillota bacterium]|nr:methyl-accepting chemotaxis protein [Bacillota bacterium]